jgi:heterodisulfide reductase subunit A-like polyferredoxin
MVAPKRKDKVGAVMVVGAGVGGMQASLDLAESGFLVYLVETSTAVGGVMAQLDKTFPTNDCAMCIIAPKLVEVGRHPNIKLMTSMRVKKIDDFEGNFKVTVHKTPRYIDPSKCTACGDCVSVCPVVLPNEYEQGLSTRRAVYKKYVQAIPSAFAIQKADKAPCRLECPAGINVQGYVQMVGQRKYREALEIIMEDLPLPGVIGRICPHPCQNVCRRGDIL